MMYDIDLSHYNADCVFIITQILDRLGYDWELSPNVEWVTVYNVNDSNWDILDFIFDI